MTNKELQTWETMVELGICTDEELGLATALCGTNIHTLESVLYIRTGYRSLEQFMEETFDELTDFISEADETGFNPYSGSYDFDC